MQVSWHSPLQAAAGVAAAEPGRIAAMQQGTCMLHVVQCMRSKLVTEMIASVMQVLLTGPSVDGAVTSAITECLSSYAPVTTLASYGCNLGNQVRCNTRFCTNAQIFNEWSGRQTAQAQHTRVLAVVRRA
jgi:hypothetical protein